MACARGVLRGTITLSPDGLHLFIGGAGLGEAIFGRAAEVFLQAFSAGKSLLGRILQHGVELGQGGGDGIRVRGRFGRRQFDGLDLLGVLGGGGLGRELTGRSHGRVPYRAKDYFLMPEAF